MAKDPVCGMDVKEAKETATADYKGKSFYFCALACKEKFVKEPKKYATGGAKSSCCEGDKSSDCCK